jgi:hypothetical protein
MLLDTRVGAISQETQCDDCHIPMLLDFYRPVVMACIAMSGGVLASIL